MTVKIYKENETSEWLSRKTEEDSTTKSEILREDDPENLFVSKQKNNRC